ITVKQTTIKRLNINYHYLCSTTKSYIWDDKIEESYTRDFRRELLKEGCFSAILERRKFSKLLAQKKYEKEIRRIEDIPDDLKKLMKHGANSVIFIEINDDHRGEINISARLSAFNNVLLAEETVQIHATKFYTPEIRRQKMKELAEKLCALIDRDYDIIKEKLYGKTTYKETEEKWQKRQHKIPKRISISPLSLMQ
ncbi:MAG: hypothetical protein DRI57_30530, partial [Deltaproteobacteria bacterium]